MKTETHDEPAEKESARNEKLMDLVKKSGIPVTSVLFHQAVDNENSFSQVSRSPLRNAEMYYTPAGLVCFRKSGSLIVPLANVVYARIGETE